MIESFQRNSELVVQILCANGVHYSLRHSVGWLKSARLCGFKLTAYGFIDDLSHQRDCEE